MSLRYDEYLHLHCELRLASGRSITMDSLDQSRTYAGLLEGLPGEVGNDMNIQSALQIASKQCPPGGKPHLIVPPRRDYSHQPGDMEPYIKKGWGRVPEWLPKVRCIGTFSSLVTRLDSDGHASMLVVVWYQDDYALPIQESVIEQLVSLDWNALATDFEY